MTVQTRIYPRWRVTVLHEHPCHPDVEFTLIFPCKTMATALINGTVDIDTPCYDWAGRNWNTMARKVVGGSIERIENVDELRSYQNGMYLPPGFTGPR